MEGFALPYPSRVDDGARNLDESLAMLEAAKAAGITSIVCTPHVRDPYFDYDAMWDAYELLVAHADGFPLTMGFEVNHSKLMQLGMEWAEHLHFDGTNEFYWSCLRGRASPTSRYTNGPSSNCRGWATK